MNVVLFSRNSHQMVWLGFLLGWDTVTKSSLGKTGSILSYNSQFTLWGLKEGAEAPQLSYTIQDHRPKTGTAPSLPWAGSSHTHHQSRKCPPCWLAHRPTGGSIFSFDIPSFVTVGRVRLTKTWLGIPDFSQCVCKSSHSVFTVFHI